MNLDLSLLNISEIYLQDTEDGDTTIVSATNDDSNSKTGLNEDSFEVVTIESDYQVSSNQVYRRGGGLAVSEKHSCYNVCFDVYTLICY